MFSDKFFCGNHDCSLVGIDNRNIFSHHTLYIRLHSSLIISCRFSRRRSLVHYELSHVHTFFACFLFDFPDERASIVPFLIAFRAHFRTKYSSISSIQISFWTPFVGPISKSFQGGLGFRTCDAFPHFVPGATKLQFSHVLCALLALEMNSKMVYSLFACAKQKSYLSTKLWYSHTKFWCGILIFRISVLMEIIFQKCS